MKRIIPVILLAAALVATGCSSAYRSARQPSILVELNSSDYELSEPVTGTAHVTRVLGINFENIFNSHLGDASSAVVGTSLDSFGLLSASDKACAIYDLLEKNPGWDFVVYPQFIITGKDYLVYSDTDIIVTARLGRLKNK